MKSSKKSHLKMWVNFQVRIAVFPFGFQFAHYWINAQGEILQTHKCLPRNLRSRTGTQHDHNRSFYTFILVPNRRDKATKLYIYGAMHSVRK